MNVFYRGHSKMLCIILIFSMVAPHMVFCTESDDKAFLNVSKLSGASNWMLFVGSLSVALLTVKEEVNKAASAVFMRLQEQAKDLMEETELEDFIKSFKRGSGKLDEKIAGFDAVNGSLFKIIYESISNTLTSVKNTAVNKYFGKGVELFMYLYKRFGVILYCLERCEEHTTYWSPNRFHICYISYICFSRAN